MKTTTFDYDNKIIAEWYRVGNCNHCGECCNVMIHLKQFDNSDGRDGMCHTDNKGVWYEWVGYGRTRYWKTSIEWENKIHDCYDSCGNTCYDGSPSKGLICTAWPLHPLHVEGFDNCSYQFIKLNEWKMEDDTLEQKIVEGV